MTEPEKTITISEHLPSQEELDKLHEQVKSLQAIYAAMDQERTQLKAELEAAKAGTLKIIVEKLAVRPFDIVVMKYREPKVDEREAREDYINLRDFFKKQGLIVRLLQLSGSLDLETVTAEHMAKFGWVKH